MAQVDGIHPQERQFYVKPLQLGSLLLTWINFNPNMVN